MAAARTKKFIINCIAPCLLKARQPRAAGRLELKAWYSSFELDDLGHLIVLGLSLPCPLNGDDNTVTSEFHAEGSDLGKAS